GPGAARAGPALSPADRALRGGGPPAGARGPRRRPGAGGAGRAHAPALGPLRRGRRLPQRHLRGPGRRAPGGGRAVSPQRVIFDVGQPGYGPRWMPVFDRMQVVDGDVELLPGLDLVCLPGHTPGMQGVSVATAGGAYLIAGDAVPLYENWEGDAHLR